MDSHTKLYSGISKYDVVGDDVTLFDVRRFEENIGYEIRILTHSVSRRMKI